MRLCLCVALGVLDKGVRRRIVFFKKNDFKQENIYYLGLDVDQECISF